jgi:hypothetical protein
MAARWLTSFLMALMFAQALLGLLLPAQYKDAEWIRVTWYGNDWITILGAVPLLWIGIRTAARGSVRGLLLTLGMVAYSVYNYAFYLFGAALNVFFPLYVVIFVVAIVTLGLALSHLDIGAVAERFHRATPVPRRRWVSGRGSHRTDYRLAGYVGSLCVCRPPDSDRTRGIQNRRGA